MLRKMRQSIFRFSMSFRFSTISSFNKKKIQKFLFYRNCAICVTSAAYVICSTESTFRPLRHPRHDENWSRNIVKSHIAAYRI